MIRREIERLLNVLFPAEKIVIDSVPRGRHGDYSTNLAFLLAKKKHASPMKIADEIAPMLKSPALSRIHVEEPGFINFEIALDYLLKNLGEGKLLPVIKDRGRILVEFVSANPTGPINIVSARAAAVGDSLVRLLNKIGYDAQREYYVNDTGQQAEMLAISVARRMREIAGEPGEIPEHGYHGEYLIPLAREIIAQGGMENARLKDYAVNYFVERHRETLARFGVVFDRWARESAVCAGEYPETALRKLRAAGKVFEQDGAVFFRATDYGDNRDRVLVTTDRRATYLLNDLGYHLHKIERKYDRLINLLGPDHHGQIKGLVSGITAMGFPAELLEIIIIQHVSFRKDGRAVSMSKRTGDIFTLDELIDQVPVDVIRFFFLMRSCSQHLDFDIDLALKQTDENPVYYVQYAHARIMSIIRHGRQQGIDIDAAPELGLIEEPEEIDLAKQIGRFDEVLEDSARNFEPYQITYYLIDLARNFHYFYQRVKVVTEDARLSRARIFLIEQAARVFRQGLEILGVSCPDEM